MKNRFVRYFRFRVPCQTHIPQTARQDTVYQGLPYTVERSGLENPPKNTARVRDISQEVLAPREAMPLLMQQAINPVALLFGTEMSGLTNEELARCQLMVRIPVSPDYTSLNLAAAVQLICYELRLAAGQGDCGAPEVTPASAEHVEGFFQQLEETLVEIEFLNGKHPTKLMHKLRRLYARARLEPEEINILRGILTLTTQYHGKLKQEVKKRTPRTIPMPLCNQPITR